MTPKSPRFRDIAERTFWTAVAAAIGSIGGATILDVEAWKAAVIAAANAVITGVLVFARWRLAILPDPGDGLPGIHTDHSGPWTNDGGTL